MPSLNYESVVNQVSMGQVSVNFLREFYNRKINVSFSVISDNFDFTAFNKTSGEFQLWVQKAAQNKLKNLNPEAPNLKLWHINGSEKSLVSRGKNYLYTFYEADSPTEEEKNIVKCYDHVFFSSSHASKCFIKAGCHNVSYVPLGFDPDFGATNKEYLGKDVIHFGLIGKFEHRKNTRRIIQIWLDKYGNDNKYQLSLLINNSFFKDDDFNKILIDTLKNQRWTNINLLPRLNTNEEVNELTNAIDIDLSGVSGGEGWNLPSFNACCLGKVAVVTEAPGMEDWAHGENVIKISGKGSIPVHDGVFFVNGMPFNQGNFVKIDDEDISKAMDDAIILHQNNSFGVREDLIESFSYKRSVDDIFEVIYS